MAFVRRSPKPGPVPEQIAADPHPVHTASAARLDNYLLRKLNSYRQPWQDAATNYAVDVISQVCGRARLTIEQRDPNTGQWSELTGSTAAALLAAFRPATGSPELIAGHVWLRETIGESYLLTLDDPENGGVAFHVAHPKQLTFGGNVVTWHRSPATQPVHLDPRQVTRMWRPDPVYPDHAYSPLRRGLPDVSRYLSLTRNISRSADSRMLTNGVLWFHTSARSMTTNAPDQQAGPGGVDRQPGGDVINDYLTLARRGFETDDSFVSRAPFPLVSEQKPEWVDVGRGADQHVLALVEQALNAYALSADVPAQLVREGIGGGSHWSDWLVVEQFLKETIAPRLDDVTHTDFTAAWLRPFIRALIARGTPVGLDPSQVRLGYSLAEVAKKPDESDKAFKAWEAGLISSTAAANAMGYGQTERLELPEGTTDFDLWQMSRSHVAVSERAQVPATDLPIEGPPPTPTDVAGPPQAEIPARSGVDLPARAAALQARTAGAGNPPDIDSLMIALYPPADVATALTFAGGDPPEQLHVTLAFFDDPVVVNPDSLEALYEALSAWAAQQPPIRATFTHIGHLGPDSDGRIAVALEAGGSPELHAFRARLADYLTAAGFAPDNKYPYRPHLTLGYWHPDELPAQVASPRPLPAGQLISFVADHVTITVAGEQVPVRLGGVDPFGGVDAIANIAGTPVAGGTLETRIVDSPAAGVAWTAAAASRMPGDNWEADDDLLPAIVRSKQLVPSCRAANGIHHPD